MKNYHQKYPISFTPKQRLKHQYSGLMSSHQMDIGWMMKDIRVNLFQFGYIAGSDFVPPSIEKNYRLGQRVEYFFKYYIESSSRYKLILNNIQIEDEFRTIGELDYILFDYKTNQNKHLELAYKFYCYDESVSEIEEERWIGPNRKDSFVEKLQKLKSKQFPLLRSDETRVILLKNNLEFKNIQQEICFFAQLYVPYDDYGIKQYSQTFESCVVGYWLGIDKLVSKRFGACKFNLPEKQDWLIEPENNSLWYLYEEVAGVIKMMHKEENSPLLWIKTDENKYEKCFVVWW